jgi:hypothetical protein
MRVFCLTHTYFLLLFDLNAVKYPFSEAQGAVLLTYQSSSFDVHASNPWLSVAIWNAMLVGAHQYHQESNSAKPRTVEKKRLWRSILLRDRIMPLALRHSPPISPSHFDLHLEGLDRFDLQDEIAHSKVYDEDKELAYRLALLSVSICTSAPRSFDDCL